ncbi:cobalamin-binding protein [Massilia terrae]|uniref:Cobalamin-binding protein n=1 Tax=Massilia terrae TaxID=1811224 RepID=A0ABT2D194_9BURK|nr:cobalamin-binding protein [Massilia terrae]MCS0659123.1 cobalamin-binding protein [Massilia terrae]
MNKLLPALLLSVATAANAAVTVVDDTGARVTLARPAQRVISMAPHATELLFAAGGGKRIVGAMNWSDYPPEAKAIPLVGSNSQIDIERVIALKPDLIVVWQSGNTARQIEQLARLGIPVFHSEPRKLEQVASSIERFGALLGTEQQAQGAAADYRATVARLAARYAHAAPVRVFYQVWDKPIYTLNDQQIVSDMIRTCGGQNVFGKLAVIAPEVSLEAVLAKDPEVILSGDEHAPGDRGIHIWKPYKAVAAVQRGNLFTLDGELLTRPGPRTADGTAKLCEVLDVARGRRP